jgi:iron complex transport system permease protein
MTAVIVSLLGPIGFIGLVAPHIARMLVGSDHRYLIPVTCVTGATLLILADTLSCLILAPAVLPVGITTSFVGVPLLIYLVMKRKREHW